MRSTLGNLLLALALAAAPAAAQFTGYDEPGSLGEEPLTAREAVMRSYQNARWRIGFLDLDPTLAITDLGYVSNIYSTTEQEAESDFKAQGTAGLRGFFNLGPKVVVSPFASLSYTWWQDQDQLRSSNESYGLQLFGDFNRLQLQLQGGRIGTQRNLSSELEVPVDAETDSVRLDLEVDFWGPFRLFATASDARSRTSGRAAEERLPGLDLSLLDVDTELLGGGLAYELSNGLSIGVGYEAAESTFLEDPARRSNRGAGPLLRLALAGRRATIDVQVSQRDLEFDAREASDTRDQVIGRGLLAWRFTEKLSANLYAASRLDASALDSAAIFEGRRTGVSLLRRNTNRTRVRAFYEVGKDEFASVTSDEVTRVDDFVSFGLNYRIEMGERLILELGFIDSQRDSSDPEFDRDLRAITSRVRLGSNLLPW